MQSFGTAKNVLNILMFIGWAYVALTIIGGVIAISETNTNIFVMVFAVCLSSVFGILIVAIAQIGLAQIATAENTRQMLQVLSQGNVNTQEKTKQRPSSRQPQVSTNFGSEVGDVIKTYKGFEIIRASSGVEVEGTQFANLLDAEKWINKNPKS